MYAAEMARADKAIEALHRAESSLAVAQAVNAKMRLSCRSIAETFIPYDESQCALALSEMRDAIDELAGGKDGKDAEWKPQPPRGK
jgi:hypothetical protein